MELHIQFVMVYTCVVTLLIVIPSVLSTRVSKVWNDKTPLHHPFSRSQSSTEKFRKMSNYEAINNFQGINSIPHLTPPSYEEFQSPLVVMVNINKNSSNKALSFLFPNNLTGQPLVVNGGSSTSDKLYNILYINPRESYDQEIQDEKDILARKDQIYPLHESLDVPEGVDYSDLPEIVEPKVFLIKYRGDGNGALLGQNGVSTFNKGEISFKFLSDPSLKPTHFEDIKVN